MSEIEAEKQMTRSEIASYLHEFADELDTSTTDIQTETESRRDDHQDRRVTFMVGDDSATVNPPEQLSFEVQVGRDSSIVGGSRGQEVSFELAWRTEEQHDDEHETEMEIK